MRTGEAGQPADLLTVARWLRDKRGFSPIPIRRSDKRPAVKWEPYQQRRATDDELIAWFGNGEPLNLGIVTGAISGIVAVDEDGPDAQAWADENLPPTGMATRTSKGRHRFYRHPGRPVPNGVRLRHMPLDVRGDGGYVVVPPSLHPSGAQYERLGSWPVVAQLPVFDPAWLAEPTATTPEASTRPGRGLPDEIHEGERNDHLYRLARSLVAKRFGVAEVVAALHAANRARCRPMLSDREVKQIAEHATTQPDRSARERLDTDVVPERSARAVLVRLDTVRAERVEWLWPLRLARGKLTVLAGDPGLGKSYVALDVAARVSRGATWADDSGPAPLGDVLLLTAEDGLADTVRPRLDRLGGDPARVHVLAAIRDGDDERPFSLDRDRAQLETALDSTGAVLCVIDPVSAYLGAADSYKDAEVRALLAPLAQLAESRRVAVLVVMHLRKSREGHALQRVSGSIAFGAAARVVLGLGKDEQDPERRLMGGVKSNVGRSAPTLAFRIVGDADDAATLEWELEPVEGVDGEQLLNGTPLSREERDSAREFFDAELPEGDTRPAKEMFRQAAQWGLSRSTVNRHRAALGIETLKGGFKDGWLWFRPPKVLTKVLTPETVSTFAPAPAKSAENTALPAKVLTSPEMSTFGEPVSTFGEPVPAPAEPSGAADVESDDAEEL